MGKSFVYYILGNNFPNAISTTLTVLALLAVVLQLIINHD